MNVATTPVVVHALHVTTGGGDWGPATIAAIIAAGAAILLAFVTYWLARETHNLAKATAADLTAEWRPVLVPATRHLNISVSDSAQLGNLSAAIQNGGRGPALNIKAVCFSASSGQTMRSGPSSLGTLSVGEQRAVKAAGMLWRDTAGNASAWLRYYLVFVYEDLAQRRYMSTLIYTDEHPDHLVQGADSFGNTIAEWKASMTSMKAELLGDDAVEDALSRVPEGLWPVEHEPNQDPGQLPEPN